MSKRYIFVAVVRVGAVPPELTEPWELVKTNATDQVYHAHLTEEFVLANQTRLMQALGDDPDLLWFNIQPEMIRGDQGLKMRLREFLGQYYYGLWVAEGFDVRRTGNISHGEHVYLVTRLVEPNAAGYTRINGSWGSTTMRRSEVVTLFGNDTVGEVVYTGN